MYYWIELNEHKQGNNDSCNQPIIAYTINKSPLFNLSNYIQKSFSKFHIL
ncbi:Uncharacterized protein BM_BM13429 [Brugia malayi]|uniref:Bm13429 n=1 Tax=Brugia malayi TaxID=6279 RepID=A0A0J9YBZ5_BRUMA|nr:Uncharacterized protein BM_BM13429 [Brugia malayi]CDQ05883.1 Bm13429 [Brugia malayi]VIP00231.1 Uncharacterized protein BM_BM13429 [Brugia malayi]